MRVFVTGATGFIGSHLVPELIAAGHNVVGLARTDDGEAALRRAGADAVRGDVNDLKRLRMAAASSDGIIHTAFSHDFSKLKEASENDRKVILALGEGLSGWNKPLIITSGTGLAKSRTGEPTNEADEPMSSAEFARGATEEAAQALIADDRRVMVVRLPQVHDRRHQGRITQQIALARVKGEVAYVGEGGQRVPAVHVSDAVRLFRLVLEKGRASARYHAVAEEGVTLRDIAEAIGLRFNLPVRSMAPEAAPDYFGWMAPLVTADLASSGVRTRREMD